MIRFKNVLPIPLQELGVEKNSQIWGQELTFVKGKMHLIRAASGKGKSTFLHLIYGLRKDYHGKIFINEENIFTLNSNNWANLRQQSLSMVFQNLRLFPKLNAYDNILLNAHQQNLDSLRSLIEDMALQLGVKDLLSKPAGQLSFGQQQRIAIIRALIHPFDFLLLDEPFSHLDAANIRQAITLILSHCKKNNAGLILVSLGADYGIEFDMELSL